MIIKSIIIDESVQIDGRRWVTEKHIDDVGVEHLVTYLAEADLDIDKEMQNRIAIIEDSLKPPKKELFIIKGKNVSLTKDEITEYTAATIAVTKYESL